MPPKIVCASEVEESVHKPSQPLTELPKVRALISRIRFWGFLIRIIV